MGHKGNITPEAKARLEAYRQDKYWSEWLGTLHPVTRRTYESHLSILMGYLKLTPTQLIKHATTPEYLELQKTNDQLQKDNNDLVAQQNDLSSKYDSLKANYDQTVAKSNQLQSDYNSADQDLANYKTFTYVLIVLAAVLAAAMVFIAAFQRRRVKGAQPSPQPPEKHDKSAPPAREQSPPH